MEEALSLFRARARWRSRRVVRGAGARTVVSEEEEEPAGQNMKVVEEMEMGMVVENILLVGWVAVGKELEVVVEKWYVVVVLVG